MGAVLQKSKERLGLRNECVQAKKRVNLKPVKCEGREGSGTVGRASILVGHRGCNMLGLHAGGA